MNTTGIDFSAMAMMPLSAAVDGLDQEEALTRKTKRSVATILGPEADAIQSDQAGKRARKELTEINAAWVIDSETLKALGITPSAQPNAAVAQAAAEPFADSQMRPADEVFAWWNDPTEHFVHGSSDGVQVNPRLNASDAGDVADLTHAHTDWLTIPAAPDQQSASEWANVDPPAEEAVIASAPAKDVVDVSISPEEMDRLLDELQKQPTAQAKHRASRRRANMTQEQRETVNAAEQQRSKTEKRLQKKADYNKLHYQQKKKAAASQQSGACRRVAE